MNHQRIVPARTVLGPLALMLSLEVYLVVAWASQYLPWTTVPAGEAFLPEFRRALHPESQERWLYLFGLASVLVLPLGFLTLLKRFAARSPEVFDRMRRHPAARYGDVLLASGILVWLLGLALNSEIPAAPAYLLVAAFAAIWLPCVARSSYKVPALLIHGLAALLIVFGSSLLGATEELLNTIHSDVAHCLDLPLGVIQQVLHGRTVLIDTSSQYGVLYPYVGALFVAVCGLSVAQVSLFFVLLSALSLLGLYLALARKFGATPWTLGAFAAIVGLSHPYWAWSLEGFPDYFHIPYYQYYPLRVVCGTFFLWFVRVYLDRPTWQLRTAGFAAAGFSALWNMDTGLVILVAWTGVLLYDRLGRSRSRAEALRVAAAHGVWLLLTLGLGLSAYALGAWLRTGSVPNLGEYARFQRIYYGSGFGMAPCMMWEFWQPIVLVYVVTIFHGLYFWRRASGRKDRSWYVYIALYGLGIFSYYQGRNDIRNLLATCYPAVLLCCCWAWDWARQLRAAHFAHLWRYPTQRRAFVLAVAFGLMPCWGLANFFRGVPSAVAYARALADSASIVPHQPVLNSLTRLPLRGKEVVICSDRASYFHIHTHSWSALPFSSCSEVVLVEDLAKIQELLDRTGPAVVAFRAEDGRLLQIARHLDLRNYRVVDEHDGTVLFEPLAAAAGATEGGRREAHD